MRLLQLHSDFIEYKLIKKEAAIAEESDFKEQRLEDLAVIFTCIEEGDDEAIVREAIKGIKESLDMLNVKRILIYPYAHLSNNLARPAEAMRLLDVLAKYAEDAGFEVHKSPFGWNKQFTISIKGHPLAERFMVITAAEVKEVEEKVPEALKAEEKQKSSWYIIQTDGKLIPLDDYDFSGNENLEKFARYEVLKSRKVSEMPPHVTLMRRLEMVDYEPGSDPGNFRYYPKGKLVKSLMERYVTEKVRAYGAMEVETPIMYDLQHPSLANYLNRFPARQYIVRSDDKDYFLRFAACFGQFLMLHDAKFSYKQLPLRIYELTRYSFRREKSGELVGLRRLRAFTMPDCHAVCANLAQAKEEFLKRFKLCIDVLEGFDLKKEDYELAIRFTRDFYEQNRDIIEALVKTFGKPALVEVWDDRIFYFILKWEFNFIDNLDKASALSTDQIDVENAKRYGITYVDEKGARQYPLILHCSPSGAIERDIYAILEKAYKDYKQKGVPRLPLWLAPTQVRLIPLSDDFLPDTIKIADEIEKHNIRVDVDDRGLTVQRRVMEAEREWIRYILVFGEKERDSGVLTVRDRELGEDRLKMSLEELIAKVRSEAEGKPFQRLPLPRLLSKRPRFYG